MSMHEKQAYSPKAIDLSHHLSDISKARKLSPLKGLQKYAQKPGMIQLAGGLPDPSYFPFASISADALLPDSFDRKDANSGSSLFGWFWNMFGAGSSEKSERFSIPKYGDGKEGTIDLASHLQYSSATGAKVIQDFIRDFTEIAFTPAFGDWQTLVHSGNTDGFHRAALSLLNSGEYLITEEWSYPSAMSNVKPAGVKIVGIKVDGQGMSAIDLERVLTTWDEKERGAKRPHVMYTVPIGQNPTGATMGEERKLAIYDICVRYDIIILEDDPYYFLQEGLYVPKESRKANKSVASKGDDDGKEFLKTLTPSYLKYDYQGRVIRMDSFSKVIAPGSRMGWFTCNPLFAERLERAGESSVQAPCGFSQAFIGQLLTKHWGMSNFIRWLQGLQGQYTLRRDVMVDALLEIFDVQPAPAEFASFGAGLPVMTAYLKSDKKEMAEKSRLAKTPLFSFIPPTSGMFVWLKFHVTDIPVEEDETPAVHLFIDLAESGLLIASGAMFASEESVMKDDEMNFRMSFSKGSEETLKEGVKILEKVMRKYVKA
ncbi:hypothetical protein M422DRAFT_57580 [Sphaerobolus stellatus SS14]|nr:hypothetical protein M422DRAFT_57580 [Sphaerobolus stellatus SS14]